MVELIDNGRVVWKPSNNDPKEALKACKINVDNNDDDLIQFEEEINPNNLKFKCSSFEQFSILFRRASKQIYSNKVKI
jgi:hypothetical protein